MTRTPMAAVLSLLVRQRGVLGALVVSERDGILVAGQVQVGLDENHLAALAAALHRKARLSAAAAGLGRVSFLQLEAPAGRLCASSVGDLVLVVIAAAAANVGMVRVELLRAARQLASIVEPVR